MDVAAFSGDNFGPKDWINKALRSSDPVQSKVCWLGNPWHISLTFAGRNVRVNTRLGFSFGLIAPVVSDIFN